MLFVSAHRTTERKQNMMGQLVVEEGLVTMVIYTTHLLILSMSAGFVLNLY
jgi:hypothetical protein